MVGGRGKEWDFLPTTHEEGSRLDRGSRPKCLPELQSMAQGKQSQGCCMKGGAGRGCVSRCEVKEPEVFK